MTEEAKEARREYRRKWYRENTAKQREYEARHWEKVAAQKAQSEEENERERRALEEMKQPRKRGKDIV